MLLSPRLHTWSTRCRNGSVRYSLIVLETAAVSVAREGSDGVLRTTLQRAEQVGSRMIKSAAG